MSAVSVLIVGYHAYDELDHCLRSLARYEPAAEVIVVDHDAHPIRGQALAQAHPGLNYVPRSVNPGFGAGVNYASRLATGSRFLILNPDVELRGPVLQRLDACLANRTDVAIVGGLIREADGMIQPSARRFPDLSTAFGGRTSWLTRISPGNPLTRRNLALSGSLDGPVAVDWVTGAFMMIRADVFRALGGFDERFFMYWEDSDFCLRARRAGWKTMYEPRAEAIHMTGRSRRHAPVRTTIAFHVSAFRHYWKHGSVVTRMLAPFAAAGLAVRLVIRLLCHRSPATDADAAGRPTP